MHNWLISNLGEITATVSILAFLLSLAVIAFSAARFVAGWREEQKAKRFETYYRILRIVSTGEDEFGMLKLVSQMAYIRELTKFKEYHSVTYRILGHLQADWSTRENAKTILLQELDFALRSIEKEHRIAILFKSAEYQLTELK